LCKITLFKVCESLHWVTGPSISQRWQQAYNVTNVINESLGSNCWNGSFNRKQRCLSLSIVLVSTSIFHCLAGCTRASWQHANQCQWPILNGLAKRSLLYRRAIFFTFGLLLKTFPQIHKIYANYLNSQNILLFADFLNNIG